jgi:diguanylate cyclase (GGDEF)-like protein
LSAESSFSSCASATSASALLPDHLGFLAELAAALNGAPADSRLGIAMISLDCVARIDGMMGYRAGDALCTQVAGMLSHALKQEDRIFRVGRNELVCLLRSLPGENHAILAAHKILHTLNTSVCVHGSYFYATPFVGIAIGSKENSDGDVILRQANVAMHEAKRRKDRFAIYEAKLDAPCVLQFQLQTDLRNAIAENALDVHFQPKLDLRSGLIVGVESLARWEHSSKGAIAPGKFIPVAESSGFISDLTMRILNSSLCHYDAMQAGSTHVHLAVNLSANDLQENHLPEVIRQMLGIWDVPAGSLTLELTETAVMEDDAMYGESLERLKDTGVRLSIDDFGTGYSSMSRLRNLPVDELKIDMSFVKNMLTSSPDERIVHSMINLAHDLGLLVVAEGVEDLATLQRLKEFGCDLVQGYYVSKPLDQEKIVDFLAAWKGLPE